MARKKKNWVVPTVLIGIGLYLASRNKRTTAPSSGAMMQGGAPKVQSSGSADRSITFKQGAYPTAGDLWG